MGDGLQKSYHSVLAAGQWGEDKGPIFPGQSAAHVDEGAVPRIGPLHWGCVTATDVLEAHQQIWSDVTSKFWGYNPYRIPWCARNTATMKATE